MSGRAWVDALSENRGIDPGQLIRGRGYARDGRVGDLHIEPGLIEALVQGSRPRPYAVLIGVPVSVEADWVSLLDHLAAEIGRLAALLDGELPADMANLLPGADELDAACSCLGAHCKHITAVCYAVAHAFDADPFTLLLLRGRTRAEILAAVRDRRQPRWRAPSGMLARDAYQRELAPLPPLAPPPDQPGKPASLPARPPLEAGVTGEELTELASRAAIRAWRMLNRG